MGVRLKHFPKAATKMADTDVPCSVALIGCSCRDSMNRAFPNERALGPGCAGDHRSTILSNVCLSAEQQLCSCLLECLQIYVEHKGDTEALCGGQICPITHTPSVIKEDKHLTPNQFSVPGLHQLCPLRPDDAESLGRWFHPELMGEEINTHSLHGSQESLDLDVMSST